VDPAFLALLDPEVTYEDYNLPDHVGEVYSGPEGMLEAWKPGLSLTRR